MNLYEAAFVENSGQKSPKSKIPTKPNNGTKLDSTTEEKTADDIAMSEAPDKPGPGDPNGVLSSKFPSAKDKSVDPPKDQSVSLPSEGSSCPTNEPKKTGGALGVKRDDAGTLSSNDEMEMDDSESSSESECSKTGLEDQPVAPPSEKIESELREAALKSKPAPPLEPEVIDLADDGDGTPAPEQTA